MWINDDHLPALQRFSLRQRVHKEVRNLDLLEPGDEVMADKGFTIKDMLSSVGARLIISPFKCAKQFSKQDCEKTQAIARLRILVESVIPRVKKKTRLGFCCATHLVGKHQSNLA